MDKIVVCIMWITCLIAALGGTVLTRDVQCLLIMLIPASVMFIDELWG